MFGRHKEPAKLTVESPTRRFSFRDGSIGPKLPMSEIMDQGQIDLLNHIQDQTGRPIDLFAPSVEAPMPVADMSDPGARRIVAGLEDEIKQGIERRGGKLALERATLEDGSLRW